MVVGAVELKGLCVNVYPGTLRKYSEYTCSVRSSTPASASQNVCVKIELQYYTAILFLIHTTA